MRQGDVELDPHMLRKTVGGSKDTHFMRMPKLLSVKSRVSMKSNWSVATSVSVASGGVATDDAYLVVWDDLTFPCCAGAHCDESKLCMSEGL